MANYHVGCGISSIYTGTWTKREVYAKAMNDLNESIHDIENIMDIVYKFKIYTKNCDDYDLFGDCCCVIAELKDAKEYLAEMGDMIHDMLNWSDM